MVRGWTKSLAIVLAGLVPLSDVAAQSLTLPSSAESRRISVVVDRGITSTRQLPTTALRQLRKEMVSGAPMAEDDLRALANQKDGLAALKLTKILRQRGVAQNASDLAYYASIAAGAGRKGMLDDMIGALYFLSPATEPSSRISQYIRVLYAHAWAGNTQAQDAMVALNGPDQLFGPMSDATRDRIVALSNTGNGRMVLSLAMKDMGRTDLNRAELNRVLGYLEIADRRGDLAIRAMAFSLAEQAKARRNALAVN